MRTIILAALSLLLGACVVAPPYESYDPRLYDADGNFATAAAPPAPECRDVLRTVEIGGQTQQAYATACRQPDGTWRFTN